MGKEKYLQAVDRVFKGWQALKVAVENSFGGANSEEKAEWMTEVTGEFVWTNWPVSEEEVEDYVGTIMNQEFDTIIEDGSLSQVSQQLCDLRKLCVGGATAAVDEYFSRHLPTTIANPSPQSTLEADPSNCAETLKKLNLEQSCDSHDQESSSEGDSAGADDGWTVVSKGKRKP